MRALIFALPLLAACSNQANHLGNPFLLPLSGISTAVENAAYNERRGAVELLVKTNHPALLQDIRTGGGPTLTDAMATAGVPLTDRDARIVQMQRDFGLYQNTPGALVTALMAYGA